jgi:aryl-alcohol dehydrogenase
MTNARITAAVLRDRAGRYEIEDVTLADPGPQQILVRIVGVGHCHTDLLVRVAHSTPPLPLVAGHEGSGIVEAVGADTDGIAVGDHVVLSYDSCRRCTNCLSGHPAYCDSFMRRNFGHGHAEMPAVMHDKHGLPVFSRWFGQSSFATHALVAARNVSKVDTDLPLELLGPLACGVQTGAGAVMQSLRVGAGESIVIVGVGAVGMSAVMAAQVCGADPIIAIDLRMGRLGLARELGATHTIIGTDGDAPAQIRALTDGGAQYALDTTGAPKAIATAIGFLRPTGVCGLLGLSNDAVVLPGGLLSFGRTVTGIVEGDVVPQTFIPRLLRLWRQGRFPFDRLITTFGLDQINEAEKAAISGDVIKPVLLPGL